MSRAYHNRGTLPFSFPLHLSHFPFPPSSLSLQTRLLSRAAATGFLCRQGLAPPPLSLLYCFPFLIGPLPPWMPQNNTLITAGLIYHLWWSPPPLMTFSGSLLLPLPPPNIYICYHPLQLQCNKSGTCHCLQRHRPAPTCYPLVKVFE